MDTFFHYVNEVAKWLAIPIFFAAAFLPDSIIGHAYFIYAIAGIAAINIASAVIVHTPMSFCTPVTGTGRFLAFLVTGVLVTANLYLEGLMPVDTMVEIIAIAIWIGGTAFYLFILLLASEAGYY